MSIASEITRLQGVKSDILQAISDKGVTVPAGSALADCPTLIASITGGDIPEDYEVIGEAVYPTVTINGLTWLAENLDLKNENITLGANNYSSEPNAHYLLNDENSYGKNGLHYGLLYNLAACQFLENNKSGLFPGWHVATIEEWDNLISFTEAANNPRVLETTYQWASPYGSNNYHFNMLPACRYVGGTDFSTSTMTIFFRYGPTVKAINFNSSAINYWDPVPYDYDGYSIRLVKDH